MRKTGDANQKEGSKVSYGTASIKGTYSPLLSSHDDCYKRYGVDPTDDKDFIDSWFGTADFYRTSKS